MGGGEAAKRKATTGTANTARRAQNFLAEADTHGRAADETPRKTMKQSDITSPDAVLSPGARSSLATWIASGGSSQVCIAGVV